MRKDLSVKIHNELIFNPCLTRLIQALFLRMKGENYINNYGKLYV